MRSGSSRVRIAGLAALAALALTATACADDGTTPSGTGTTGAATEIKSGLKIAFLPKQVNNPYFDTSDNKGGKVAVEEFKGTYSETGPTQASPSAQVSYINTLSQQGTNVIVVSANDKDAICGALNEARQAGAKVVTFDSDTNPTCRDLFINQATAEGIAASQIKLISDAVGRIDAGSKQVAEAGKTMEEIVDSVKRVTDIMGEITAASQEQTSGIEQINQAITQMDQVTQQNAALVEEASAASQSMAEQSRTLGVRKIVCVTEGATLDRILYLGPQSR